MRSFFTPRRLMVFFAVVATLGFFWKPILAHSSHQLRRLTYGPDYAPGKEHYVSCFFDTEIISFGGRFGIEDLRRFATDPTLAEAGRSRAKAAVDYYDYGYFARDYVNYHHRLAEEFPQREPWYWFLPEYWEARIKADYFAYLAEGAPQPPDTPEERAVVDEWIGLSFR
jgi:hypothetical protein